MACCDRSGRQVASSCRCSRYCDQGTSAHLTVLDMHLTKMYHILKPAWSHCCVFACVSHGSRWLDWMTMTMIGRWAHGLQSANAKTLVTTSRLLEMCLLSCNPPSIAARSLVTACETSSCML